MRRLRSHKNRTRRFPKVYRAASLLALSVYGIGHMTVPTHAVFESSETNVSSISSAFVFPQTVNDLAGQAVQRAGEAARFREASNSILAKLSQPKLTSEEAAQLASMIAEAAGQSRQAADSIASILAELQSYVNQAQLESSVVQSEVATEGTPGQSVNRVATYVQTAYQQALSASQTANRYASEASGFGPQAAAIIEALKAEEKAKLEAEEKAKQEAEDKAKQEAEDKAKQEAEDKAKQEAADKAKQEAEDKAKQEAEDKAKQEAEDKAKQEDEDKAKQEAEDKPKQSGASESATDSPASAAAQDGD